MNGEVERAFVPDFVGIATTIVATSIPDNGRIGWQIRGDSTSLNDAELVAKFSREIYEDFSGGGRVARHVRLDVTPFYRQQGYAKSLLRESFRFYRKTGVEFVDLDAVEDGAVIWPQLGWSLHGRSIADVHQEISYVYASLHRRKPPGDFELPVFGPEIYGLKDITGNRIGVQALQNFGRSNREIRMRLFLQDRKVLALLNVVGIL